MFFLTATVGVDGEQETEGDRTLLKRTERPVKIGGNIGGVAPIFHYPAVGTLHRPAGIRFGTRRVICGKIINKPKPISNATRKGMSER